MIPLQQQKNPVRDSLSVENRDKGQGTRDKEESRYDSLPAEEESRKGFFHIRIGIPQ
jgi:hypothetical protein